jgi:hypothetical protein
MEPGPSEVDGRASDELMRIPSPGSLAAAIGPRMPSIVPAVNTAPIMANRRMSRRPRWIVQRLGDKRSAMVPWFPDSLVPWFPLAYAPAALVRVESGFLPMVGA